MPYTPTAKNRRRSHGRMQGVALLVTVAGTALGIAALSGCNPEARGFALPPGDAERGRTAFVELECNHCHSIDGEIERTPIAETSAINVTLGGTVTRVRTYGDLVTSIINPSHRLARGSDPATTTVAADGSRESLMRQYNDVLTVQQLIDLTEFLQGSYTIYVPPYSGHYFP